jgi:PHD/YefM family antitoxin component YafN of YafNO toxin-antitoxin module
MSPHYRPAERWIGACFMYANRSAITSAASRSVQSTRTVYICGMNPSLTNEQLTALERENGGPIRLEAGGAAYVLMSLDAYRSMMGIGTDEEFEESVAVLRAAMDDVRAGKTRPYREALEEIAARHGISG